MGASEFAGPVKKQTLPAKPKKTLSSVLAEFALVDKDGGVPRSVASTRQFAQGKTLTVLTRAAGDMRRLAVEQTSSEARRSRTSKAPEQLAITDIKIALVNRQRNDVCDSRFADASWHHKDFALRWNKTGISNTLEKNKGSTEASSYDPDKAESSIKTLLSKSLALEANIVCFGEFDYPLFNSKDRADSFEHDIVKMVNSARAGPVFAVLGSFHRKEKLGGAENRQWPGHLAENVAKIALSHHLRDDEDDSPPIREVLKRTPASKAGELLTGFHGIDMQVFDTIIGRIAVVICSDAYDPSIVLEFFAESDKKSEYRRDIILVPSYNRSHKLADMCQVLSLTSRSIVVMVDACSHRTSRSKEFEKSSAWVCGVPVTPDTSKALRDKHKVCFWVTEEHEADGVIKVLQVSLPALDDFVTHMDDVDPMPLFAKVRDSHWDDARN